MRSWRELAKKLIGRQYVYQGSNGQQKLDAIQRQYVSDEARLKAVVEAFLLGEGEYQPSWRRVIHVLYESKMSRLAEKIKTNAEPHQGEWVYIIPQQFMYNTYHISYISNPVFSPSAIYIVCTCPNSVQPA